MEVDAADPSLAACPDIVALENAVAPSLHTPKIVEVSAPVQPESNLVTMDAPQLPADVVAALQPPTASSLGKSPKNMKGIAALKRGLTSGAVGRIVDKMEADAELLLAAYSDIDLNNAVASSLATTSKAVEGVGVHGEVLPIASVASSEEGAANRGPIHLRPSVGTWLLRLSQRVDRAETGEPPSTTSEAVASAAIAAASAATSDGTSSFSPCGDASAQLADGAPECRGPQRLPANDETGDAFSTFENLDEVPQWLEPWQPEELAAATWACLITVTTAAVRNALTARND